VNSRSPSYPTNLEEDRDPSGIVQVRRKGRWIGGTEGGGRREARKLGESEKEEEAESRRSSLALLTSSHQGPRRILDPDARQIRAVGEGNLDADKAAIAAANSQNAPPEDLSGNALVEAEPIISIFGEDVAKSILSRNWQHRDEGLNQIIKLLPEVQIVQAARVIANILKRVVTDKNPTVFLSATALNKRFLEEAAAKKIELRGLMDNVLQGFVTKLAEPNKRVKDESINSLM